ncbi:hypothetical protein L208DRAFT_1019673, partial [Tricholoma matsutake]
SCAYDTIFVILFNIWCESPASISAAWQGLQSELLDSLVSNFDANSIRHFSLEQIQDFIRCCLSRISPQFTQWGRYASVHCIAEQLFVTCHPITVSELVCPNGHNIDRRRSPTSNCELIVFGQPGMSLQACIDDFTVPVASRCSTCDAHLSCVTSFVHTPPVLVFDLGTIVPSLPPDLQITCADTHVHYTLRGVVYHIYHGNEHFTSCVITSTGMVWFHDGLLTGESLHYE